MNKEKLNELIDKYAFGNLSDTELNQIQNEMNVNPQLIEDLNIRKDLAKGLEIKSNQELKKLLDKIHDEEINSTKSWLKYLIGFLAIVTLGFAAYFITKESNKVIEPDVIYASYYKPYEASFQNRSDLNNTKLAQFQEFYAEGNYLLAINEIKPIPDDAPDDIKLAAGISALETNDIQLAESLFNAIIANQGLYYKDHASWYLALLYLKTENVSEAKTLLSGLVSDSKADHNKEAKDLLQILN